MHVEYLKDLKRRENHWVVFMGFHCIPLYSLLGLFVLFFVIVFCLFVFLSFSSDGNPNLVSSHSTFHKR